MYRKIYIWVVSPSTVYVEPKGNFDISRFVAYAAVGGREKTLHRWEWIRRNAMSPDKQPAEVLRRYRKVAHVKRYTARIFAIVKKMDEAEELLKTLRLSHPGLLTEVLK